jgi:hypothetical protein
MKKATTEQLNTADDDMRPEYDFRGAVRGEHYKPLHEGYTVHIRRADGTTIVQQFKLEEGTVMLQPDVRAVFPDSEAVNVALRSLIALMAQMPGQSTSHAQRKRVAPAPGPETQQPQMQTE